MKSTILYEQLETDFITPMLSDEWAKYMGSIYNFISDNFKKRSMGLVCDFTKEINKVHTAVFPSKEVMQNILDRDETDVMLFVHHPSIWDIRKDTKGWYQMPVDLLKKFKQRKISIYNLHAPLDNHREYSPSKTLADALGIKFEKQFAPYYGGFCGVIGITDCKSVKELKERFAKLVSHDVTLYLYGTNEIKDNRVAIVAGGGNNIENIINILSDVKAEGINTFISGVTVKNEYSKEIHEFEEQNEINVLGGTHYSTEKFACQAMCGYFEKVGLPSEFMEGKPIAQDM